MSLVSWYYWRKFQKLKDELIDLYNYRNQIGRYEQLRHNSNMEQNVSTFKFLRG